MKPIRQAAMPVVTAAVLGLIPVAVEQLPAASAASAPDVIGQKYSDASSALSTAGFDPVVSTTVGDRKKWPDCLVSFAQQRDLQPPPNSGGSAQHQVLVSLNCDAGVASGKTPGYSAQSPEAQNIAKAAPKGSG
jgi:hypothetical protein